MPTPPKKKRSGTPKRQERVRRQDGDATQARLLEAAGRIFAELGYSAASCKLACQKAGLNPASVNYYFGSKEGLYEAVITEAHRRMMDTSRVPSIKASDARAFLAEALTRLMTAALENPASWHPKVLMREIISPSPLTAPMTARIVKPLKQPAMALIGEMLGLPADHPTVQRGYMYAFGPQLLLILLSPAMRDSLMPAMGKDARTLARDLARFVISGLDALRPAPRAAGALPPRKTPIKR